MSDCTTAPPLASATGDGPLAGAPDSGHIGGAVPRRGRLRLDPGTLLWAGDDFGVRLLSELNRRYQVPPLDPVTVGEDGERTLAGVLQTARRLLVVSAADLAKPAGTLRICRDHEIPGHWRGDAAGPPQTILRDVLAACALIGGRPDSVTLIAVQPPPPDAEPERVDAALAATVRELHRWGIALPPRPGLPEAPP